MFIAVLNLILHLVLPLAWLGWLAWRTPSSWVVRALGLVGSASYVAFFVHAGSGWATLGWYTRWALVGVALPLWVWAALRARGVAAWPRGFGGWSSAAGAGCVALLMLISRFQLAAVAGAAAPAAVDVRNPLPAGSYLVLNGGESEALNHHVHVTAQRHALDIVGMSAAGFRARGLAPAQLTEYAIYGATLRAPCAGEVLVARDGLEDLPVGLPGEAGRRALLGNAVLIHCTSDITIVLAHLKPNSVRVSAGEVVEAGHELGAVGNSGNTSEPHLHLHAVRGRVSDPQRASTDAEPVRLRIDGRSPARNDRLVVPAALHALSTAS